MSRARYDALVARIEDLEDRIEMADIDRDAASRDGKSSPDALPDELVGRLLAGDHPVDVWRTHRGYTLARLEALSGVQASYISEIVNGKKPGSAEALSRLAAALGVSLDDLAAWGGGAELPENAPLELLVRSLKYNDDTRRIRIPGNVKRDTVMIVVSCEALEDLAGKSNLGEAVSIDVTKKNLGRLRKIAARKYAAHAFDDGNILIGPGDLI